MECGRRLGSSLPALIGAPFIVDTASSGGGPLGRFAVIVGLLVGVLTALGIIGRALWRGVSAVQTQIGATERNTIAITKLDARMERVEALTSRVHQTSHESMEALKELSGDH